MNTDFGLFFEGRNFAYIVDSAIDTLYTNELYSDGSSVTLWAYIFDGQREQTLLCKQNRNSATDVADKLCFGVKEGYFYAKVYNESL